MDFVPNFWAIRERHHELLRAAREMQLARELRRAQKERGSGAPADGASARKARCRKVRRAVPEDAPRIAELFEINDIPRWVAFEERFLVVEEAEELVAVLRLRHDFERLYLGLLVSNPWTESTPWR